MFTEGVTAPRGPASQVAHSDDWWVGAGCWETSVPCPKDLSIMLLDCPRGTAAASSKASGLSMPRWGLQQLEWRKAHLTVSAMFYWSQKPGLSNTGGELQGPYTRSCKWWGGGHCGGWWQTFCIKITQVVNNLGPIFILNKLPRWLHHLHQNLRITLYCTKTCLSISI